MRLVPNSNGEDNSLPGLRAFREFNPCHNPSGPDGGRFCATEGTGATVKTSQTRTRPATQVSVTVPAKPLTADTRQTPVKVKTVAEALDRILKGQAVEVEDYQTVHTLLAELGKIAIEAKAKQQEAPNYDLCKVTVKGSNLFCAERIRTTAHPEGFDRIEMPQLSAEPLPNTPAAQLPRVPGSKNVDAALAYVDHLEANGIKVGDIEEVPAGSLKATQAELIGPQVGRMMLDHQAGRYDPARDPIFISRDNYVLDGHHRWAAVVGGDAADGRLGESKMKVIRIDALMSEILYDAKDWTKRFGLKSKAAGKKKAA